jgi:hypothetical protein
MQRVARPRNYFPDFFARAELVFVLAEAVFPVLDFVRVWFPLDAAFAPPALDLGAVYSWTVCRT